MNRNEVGQSTFRRPCLSTLVIATSRWKSSSSGTVYTVLISKLNGILFWLPPTGMKRYTPPPHPNARLDVSSSVLLCCNKRLLQLGYEPAVRRKFIYLSIDWFITRTKSSSAATLARDIVRRVANFAPHSRFLSEFICSSCISLSKIP